MAIPLEQILKQIEAEENTSVEVLSKIFTANQIGLTKYEIIKRSAMKQSLQAHRRSRGLPVPVEVKKEKESARELSK